MADEQQQTSINTEQVKTAATAGVRLLDDKDMKVPMDIAINGSLGILRMLLVGVANGQLIFTSPPQAEVPKLRAVDGGEAS